MADPDDDLLREVQDNYTAASDYEGAWRQRAADDERFLYGDSYNGDQWNQAEYSARGLDDRPRLTINKTFQHFCQVNNDARQNKMGVKIVATGFGATAKAAEALEGIIRHIEYQSNAEQGAYATAIAHQVGLGRGWVHLIADYVRGADTFDQDLFIERVGDWRSVYMDPACREADMSDARWGMIVTTMDRAEFDRDYPRDKDVGEAPLASMDQDRRQDWENKNTVRVARYYRRSEERDTLWNVPPDQNGNGGGPRRESRMPDGFGEFAQHQGWPSREMFEHRVEWVLVAGSRIIDRGDTVFDRIPLVPFIGVESHVDDKADWRGLVRHMIDPQRMTNYAASKSVEGLAAGTTTGWIAPDDRIEGREADWARANIDPPAVLLYNSTSAVDGTTPLQSEIPQPAPLPQFSPGHMQLLTVSDQWMQMVTGQYQAEMGQPGNERSGRAINERQRQSDTANYHYTDNQGMALRSIGRLLVAAIPRVYDVHRAVQVMGADGTQQQAVVDPTLGAAHQVHTPQGPAPQGMDPDDAMALQGAILAVNPGVGRYDVQSDVGPSWGTQRQETFNALLQVVQAEPGLVGKVGDLLFKAADFPLAQEIANRLAPTGADPALQQAQGEIGKLTQQVQQLTAQLKDKQGQQQLDAARLHHDQVDDVMGHDNERRRLDIEARKADIAGLAAIGSVDPAMVIGALRRFVADITGSPPPIADHDDPSLGGPPPLPPTNPPGGPVRDDRPSPGDV